ncbi:hypothetical protein GCM10022296_16220 [Secundilactobacillus similis DSM 23365 = JCM 2765]
MLKRYLKSGGRTLVCEILMIVNPSLNSFQNWNQSTEKGGFQNDLPRLMIGYSFGFRSGGGGIIGNEDTQKDAC